MGWSQAELAYEAGIRERQVIRMEKEHHTPRVDMVAAVAKATGRPFDFFFEDEAMRERREAAGADDEEEAPLEPPTLSSHLQVLAELASVMERNPRAVKNFLSGFEVKT